MTGHLPPEQIERLGNYELKGEELLTALTHIEECEECRLQTRSPSKEELVDHIFGEKSDQPSNPKEENLSAGQSN